MLTKRAFNALAEIMEDNKDAYCIGEWLQEFSGNPRFDLEKFLVAAKWPVCPQCHKATPVVHQLIDFCTDCNAEFDEESLLNEHRTDA